MSQSFKAGLPFAAMIGVAAFCYCRDFSLFQASDLAYFLLPALVVTTVELLLRNQASIHFLVRWAAATVGSGFSIKLLCECGLFHSCSNPFTAGFTATLFAWPLATLFFALSGRVKLGGPSIAVTPTKP